MWFQKAQTFHRITLDLLKGISYISFGILCTVHTLYNDPETVEAKKEESPYRLHLSLLL